MGSITTALINSANTLNAYDQVFNTIQNNIANANTPGYAEQDQSLITSSGPGGGVLLGPLVSTRSQFLEQNVRTQQEQLGAATQTATDLGGLQAQFDVTGTSGVPGALSGFFNSISQLAVNPNDEPTRQSVLTAASGVAQAFNQNANAISQLTTSVQTQTTSAVATVNQIAQQIGEINKQITANPQLSGNAGLDAQANEALENLSQVVTFSTLKAPDGTYTLSIGGQTPLVIGSQVNPISLGFSAAKTKLFDSQGNDITSELSPTDGSLGALVAENNTTLPGYAASLNTVAQNFADSVNTALSQGVDETGAAPTTDLFTYNATTGAAASLQVSNLTSSQIAAASAGAPGGNGNAVALGNLATEPLSGGVTFTQAYGNVAAQVGADVSSAQQQQTTQQNLVTQAQQQRSQVSGVSLNAEAAKLLQYQQSYQAIGQFVSVLQTITQSLLSLLSTTA